jgi:hypothetical protein
LTLTPIISPNVKTELTSGLPNSVFDVQRLRIMCQRRNEQIVGLGDRPRDGMFDPIADRPLVEIPPWHAAALGSSRRLAKLRLTKKRLWNVEAAL